MALNEAKEKVSQLENAIKKLDSVKRHLNRSASDIKGEIHSCVSHNLEFLRGREVSLLGKVDQVVSQKEEALQEQQARLNQALGVLQTRMALTTSDMTLDHQLMETLSKFNEIELSPGETPHIAFRADHMALRECILNYGRVDANALPLPSAFQDSQKPSLSLPRHVEEYEDADHHIFYKTVEELQKVGSTAKSINVSIPKLSTRMEDWLQKRSVVQEQLTQPPYRTAFMSPGVSSLSKASCGPSAPKDINSLNNWLSQIKHHADLEEEHDFEIVDNSQKRPNDTESNMKKDDLTPWILSSPGYLNNVNKVEGQSQNFFKHIPADSKYWLKQACQQVSSLDEFKQKDLFSHISNEPSTWLRSRAHMKQQSQTANEDGGDNKPMFMKEKDMSCWLLKNSKPKLEKTEVGKSCCEFDPWLQNTPVKKEKKSLSIPFQLEDICKANELCSSLSDCVSSPNCAALCQQEMSGVKNPIDPTKLFNPIKLSQSAWLRSDDLDCCEKMDTSEIIEEEKDDAKSCSEEKNLFRHIADANNDQWLLKPSSSVSNTTNSFSQSSFFKQNKEEANMWLRQAPGTNQEMVPAFTMNCNLFGGSMSDWLLSTPKSEEIVSKEDEESIKEESEGWSLCSSPSTSSFNSEQFNKDVRVATTYLQNWVL